MRTASRRRTAAGTGGLSLLLGEITFFLKLLMLPFLPVIYLYKLFFRK